MALRLVLVRQLVAVEGFLHEYNLVVLLPLAGVTGALLELLCELVLPLDLQAEITGDAA